MHIVKRGFGVCSKTLWDVKWLVWFTVTTRCDSALSFRDGYTVEDRKGSNLYQFWGHQVTDDLAKKMVGSKYLISVPVMSIFSTKCATSKR